MSAAPAISQSRSPQTPLVNLFAYLRDLFRQAEPAHNFETEATALNQQWFAWQQLQSAAQQAPSTAFPGAYLSLQWQKAEKPWLVINEAPVPQSPDIPSALQPWVRYREEEDTLQLLEAQPLSFDQNPERVAAYQEFYMRVHGQSIHIVRDEQIPTILDAWVTLDEENGYVVVNHLPEAWERLDADAERVALWEALNTDHQTYLQEKEACEQINSLFQELQAAYFQQQKHTQPLVLSFGLLEGKKKGTDFRHFLFHLSLRMEMEQRSLKVYRTTEEAPLCEATFVDLMDGWFKGERAETTQGRRQAVMQQLEAFQAQSHDVDFSPNYLRFHYHAAAMQILQVLPGMQDRFFDSQGNLNLNIPAPLAKDGFRFSFSPVIRFHAQAETAPVSIDASRIMQQVQQLMREGKTNQIPSYFRHLFSVKQGQGSVRIAYKRAKSALSLKETQEDHLSIPQKEDPRFYFPLPYNDEQLAIAQRLETDDAVTVKGPPGTGKSHTIANLLSHYAALGKSVLVVSKNPKALQVIHKKLPAELQQLGILLHQESMASTSLKHAIDAIKDHLNGESLDSVIEELEDQLAEIESRIEDIEAGIESRISLNSQTWELYDPSTGIQEERTLIEWAKRHAERVDVPKLLGDDIPANAEEDLAAKLFELIQARKAFDPSLKEYSWPDASTWPDLDTFQKQMDELQRLSKGLDLAAYESLPANAFGSDVLSSWKEIQPHLLVVERNKKLLTHPAFRREVLVEVIDANEKKLLHLDAKAATYVNQTFNFGPTGEHDPDKLLNPLERLMDKYDRDGTLSIFKRKLLPKDEKAFYSCSFNGKAVQSYRDLRACQTYLTSLKEQQNLAATLERYLQTVGNTSLKGSTTLPLIHARNLLSELMAVEKALTEIERLNAQLTARRLPALEPLAEDFAQTCSFLSGIETVAYIRSQRQRWQYKAQEIQFGAAELHPIVGELAEAISQGDADVYCTHFATYQGLIEQLSAIEEWEDRTRSLRIQLPRTLRQIEAGEGSELRVGEIEADIFHQNLQQLLDQQQQALAEVTPLLEEWRHLRSQRPALIAQLAAAQAWSTRQEHVTDEQLSALSAWRNDLVNVGKGHGKNTQRHLASARANLKLVQDAIPIWIVQQEMVSSFFDKPEPGQFDLLIIDEASQCDISALNLIFRAKKSIIVGDENQTAVFTQPSQFPIERTNSLLDRYLSGHPFQQQFNINNRTASIYSLSGVIYPNIISLREHFRCLPEIIDFSNQEVYNDQIVALRTPGLSPWGAPTEVHYIEDDPKDAKKPHLVSQTANLIRSLITDYEAGEIERLPTLGVICLESSNEAHKEHLMRILGRDRQIKPYIEEMELVMGTARALQGDERDIIILTTTASHGFTPKGRLKAPRAVLGEEMMRIYNVAVSRARDKVVLLHSILPDAIPLMKESCYRRRLIEWMMQTEAPYTPNRATRDLDDRLTPFMQTLQHITTKKVEVNYRIGDHKVDFAMLEGDRPHALIVDGLPDRETTSLHTQAQLERLGWSVARLQYGLWETDKESISAIIPG